jgi:hypothetical protein
MADSLGPAPTAPSEGTVSLLHDHYKESFQLIRAREKQRDRSFFLLIGLFALLFVEVQYPASIQGAVGPVTVAGAQFRLSALPLSALLSASWLLTLGTSLMYCRVSVNVERQYLYLHKLENWISQQLDVPNLYRREGAAYLLGYPVVLNWAWFCYVIVFPASALVATITLVALEWASLQYASASKLFDSAIALSVAVSVVLYRVAPALIDVRRKVD